MRAFVSLFFFTIAACAYVPHNGGAQVVFGRIVATPVVDLWLGHVTADGVAIYDVELRNLTHRRIGLIPTGYASCPYSGRPREQLFRIEYAAGSSVVYPAGRLSRHLVTSNEVIRCELATPRGVGRR